MTWTTNISSRDYNTVLLTSPKHSIKSFKLQRRNIFLFFLPFFSFPFFSSFFSLSLFLLFLTLYLLKSTAEKIIEKIWLELTFDYNKKNIFIS